MPSLRYGHSLYYKFCLRKLSAMKVNCMKRMKHSRLIASDPVGRCRVRMKKGGALSLRNPFRRHSLLMRIWYQEYHKWFNRAVAHPPRISPYVQILFFWRWLPLRATLLLWQPDPTIALVALRLDVIYEAPRMLLVTPGAPPDSLEFIPNFPNLLMEGQKGATMMEKRDAIRRCKD